MTSRQRDRPARRPGELDRDGLDRRLSAAIDARRRPTGRGPDSPWSGERGVGRSDPRYVELQELEELRGLVAKGQRVGVLSYAEIATATAGLDVDEADVEELHRFFERSEIELVEDFDSATAVANELERAPDKRGRGKAKVPLDLRQT